MIFLLDYDRGSGKMVSLRTYADSQRQQASAERLELEIDCHRRGIEREIVVLQAASKEALMKTHRRYFADLKELIEGMEAVVKGL